MASKYGKIDGKGKIIYAPAVLKPAAGGFIINPSEETLVQDGWIPIEEIIPEHDESDRLVYKGHELQDGKIVITYEIVESSDSYDESIDAAIEDLEDEVASLTSQNAILSSQNATLTQANATLAQDNSSKDEAAELYMAQYLEEKNKADDLEDSVAEWKSKYVAEEELQEQVAFYQEAAVKGQYLEHLETEETHETVLCYGERRDAGEGDDSSDDDTRFYKKAYIVSKVQFVPLRIYSVTDGSQVRWLVYTPPDKAVTIGGVPYPIVEAHGGDWVELDIRDKMSDSDASSDDSSSGDGTITVFCWQDENSAMHIGTQLPERYLSYFEIGTLSDAESEA